MTYRNKKTGVQIETKCEISGDDWIQVQAPEIAQETKPEEKPTEAPKKAAKKPKK